MKPVTPKHLPAPIVWAHLKLLRTYREPVYVPGPKGVPYPSQAQSPAMLELQCDCNHVFSIRRDQFPGKRRLKSCGRLQCPYTPRPKAPRRPTVLVHWTIPVDLQELVADLARARGLTASKAAMLMLREGVMGLAERDEWPVTPE